MTIQEGTGAVVITNFKLNWKGKNTILNSRRDIGKFPQSKREDGNEESFSELIV